MPNVIQRDEVRRMLAEENALLLDVLPRDEYEAEHIAGAVSLPLKQLNATTAAELDRSRPVITYCHDFL